MRTLRFLLWVGLTVIILAGAYTLRSYSLLNAPADAHPLAVPPGDQEIAWMSASTSGSSWERFVAGVRDAVKARPGLELEDAGAFPAQTTAVPEIAVRAVGAEGRLWFRWYKMTSEVGQEKWVAALARRQPAPLGFLGGSTSDRARDLALILQAQTSWHGPRPLLLISTATAEKVDVEANGERRAQFLMGIYPHRTFRFCFSNRQMAEAIRQFVWRHPDLRPHGNPYAGISAIGAAADGLWASLPLLATGGETTAKVHVLEWDDDPYSIDLSNQFRDVFSAAPEKTDLSSIWINHSIGSVGRPNPPEAQAVHSLLHWISAPGERQLLVLPCMDRPARRVLRGLAAASPIDVRNLVAISGDSIPFNTVCRDLEVSWHIQDIPVPLVFFCHQNPVDWPELQDWPPEMERRMRQPPPSTDDELFNADIARIVLEASFPTEGAARPATADDLAEKWLGRQPSFFTHGEHLDGQEIDGNRRGGVGEYVVYLKPREKGNRVLSSAYIQVWTRKVEGPDGWELVQTLNVGHWESREE